MPKIISEQEKEHIKNAMYIKGIELIRKKGMRRVKVDDIAAAVQIAKGSFYTYYPSKEEFLYHIMKQNEQALFDRILEIGASSRHFKDKITHALYEIYLAPDSLALYVQPSDLEYLLRKLPDSINRKEHDKSKTNFQRTMSCLGIEDAQCDYSVLANLMDGLHFIASNQNQYGEQGRAQALSILVEAIAEYLSKCKQNSTKNS
ncbi:TetR/AcrR family transcriptional regulator [Bacillus horti]|uniref:AcrR family transcriptional regulator n=1 Tax=Caldalkalibacillus horti TaxID=77523 RepID=A0ABT9VY55_9BACI|nr:TetR/AcrR family transcriptional regulator [Bacillus horti]MDQ0165925.1 AcrR family transcriptional regulator [Bacillus horti]